MNFVKDRLGKWIQAAIILVVGILCIVAGAKLSGDTLDVIASAEDTLNAISLTLGITMIVVGSLSLVMALVVAILAKKGFVAVAVPGAVLLAIGVSLVVAKYAYNLIAILITVVPYLLIALGAVVLLDACFNLFFAIKAKKVKDVLVGVIAAIVVASASIVLGALCVGNDPVIKQATQLIVFGIIVVLVGVLQFVSTFIKVPDAVVVVTKE